MAPKEIVRLKEHPRKNAQDDETDLEELQKDTFGYFLQECDPSTGLVKDSTKPGSTASVSVTGLALSAFPVSVERGFIERDDALERVLTALRFFRNSEQSAAPGATGFHGFYYHFLDSHSGKRAEECELSSIDTTLFIAGALACACYFDGDNHREREVRESAEFLYHRVNWKWMQNGAELLSYGWKPESGFLEERWDGYCEAHLMYILALGSPTFPLPVSTYKTWTDGFEWRTIYGCHYIHAGPLFIHQLSQLWLDLRGIRDELMRENNFDYYTNSCHAVHVQHEYAIRNPYHFEGYGEHCWGITACEGPGEETREVGGVLREFYAYDARGVPDGPDDGTIAPWVAVTSLPFAPDIVLPTLRYYHRLSLSARDSYGFRATFNPTYAEYKDESWVCPWYYGLNQGPLVIMVENYRTGFPWRLMKKCSAIITGLRKAGFTGGWLDEI
jgi:hypothetical protein